ncbi:MAG TPA: transcription termination/antitermination NusG family protein [Candidatus Saccharimonadales bacterium]|nr:transcription termination/antitermination NusG family protein [Candidatus Saccharimonadales bacterium]
MEQLDWLVVQSKPSQEKRAKTNVVRQGCDAYLPYAFDPILNRHGPLFRSYLFVKAAANRWGFLNNTFGVRRVLTFGDRVATVSQEIIDVLRGSENDDGIIHLPKPGAEWKKGDQLRIKYGSLVGFIGAFQGMDAHQRVRVLISILNQQTKLTVDYAMVERIEGGRTFG